MALSNLPLFNTIFISILLEAFPFILIGVLVSSTIQIFVPSEVVIRFFPRGKLTAFAAAILAGVFFPVCDCAIIPVTRGFIKKGVPLFAAVTFMLAAPIVNPIVVASTLYAFPDPATTVYRLGLGIVIAIMTGCVFLFFPEKVPAFLEQSHEHSHDCDCCHNHHRETATVSEQIRRILKHAGSEFFGVGQFVILGAFISASFHTFMPQDAISRFTDGTVLPLLIMMFTAYVLSLCSTSDAFIARSFSSQFPLGAVMGFMIFGPMMDIKNTLVLLGNFRKGFVAKLIGSLVVICFLTVFLYSFIVLKP